jgi:hydroxypyruvate isomerase
MRFSACIDMLFVRETDSPAERIHPAKAAGIDAVEFWLWSNKDLDAIEDALGATGLTLAGIVAEPFAELTCRSDHERFLDGLGQSLEVAKRLGAQVMIAQAGPELPSVSRETQHEALVEAMRRSALVLEGSGVRLALEPLNTLVDHKGYYLPSTAEGLDMVMGEDTMEVLQGRVKHPCG